MKGFLQFIRKQGVVGLAVGFILGGATSKVVAALVEDLISPILGVLLGGASSLASAVITVGAITIKWGHFVMTLLDFAVVAAVVYFVFKGLGLDRIDKVG